jgi:GTP-binding protein HflX
MCAPPDETDSRVDVADASELQFVVGRLQDDHERCALERAGGKERGQRALLDRDLLTWKEQEAGSEIGRGSPRGERPRELHHHRDASLHVTRAESVDDRVVPPPGEVPVRRHGVEVPGQDHERFIRGRRRVPERLAVAPGGRPRHLTSDVVGDVLLLPARGVDVDEGERARRDVGVGEAGIEPRQGHNPAVTPRQPDPAPGAEPERGFVVAVLPHGADAEGELAELRELARTAGVDAIGDLVQHRSQPDRRTYVGKGKLEELKRSYRDSRAEVLLVDDELDPTQQRALENALNARVVDRTQLILDIFAQHAVTAEGKLQVELAQLEYNLPRMRGMWRHLERLGGGVGTRGPGETQLETDRRLARRRASVLRRRLDVLSRQRATRRKERQRTETPTVALAGYTNVGKSTLLNALTGAGVSVNDRLFETLDPTTRGFEHDGRRYLVTDTVGFVRRLPHQLVEGFAATLEETLVADVVLHVLDATVHEDRLAEMEHAVNAVLVEIGADALPRELVLNKIDAADALHRRRLAAAYPDALQVSALTGEGLDELRGRLAHRFEERFEPVRLLVPYDDGAALSELYSLGTPVEEREDTPEGVRVVARLPHRELRRFAPYLVAEARTKPEARKKVV